jgi:polyhydroxyalkanoate synthesis regulator phasin
MPWAPYNRLMLDASKGALGKFEALLAAREEQGRRLETLREVYDLWVDAAEEGYAEVSLSPEFRAAYGDLVNKQMAVRKLVQTEVERFTGQFGMPTRTEVDSTARRMQELRREMRALQERLDAFEAAQSAPEDEEDGRRPIQIHPEQGTGQEGRCPSFALIRELTHHGSDPTRTEQGRRRALALWRKTRQGHECPEERAGRTAPPRRKRSTAKTRSSLYRFKGTNKPTAKTPMLIVYALVNRPYMVDLQDDRSLVKGLLAQRRGRVPDRLGLPRSRPTGT